MLKVIIDSSLICLDFVYGSNIARKKKDTTFKVINDWPTKGKNRGGEKRSESVKKHIIGETAYCKGCYVEQGYCRRSRHFRVRKS